MFGQNRQITFAMTAGNFERNPAHAGQQNTPVTVLHTNKRQTTSLERTCMELSSRKQLQGSPSSPELGDAERITVACCIVEDYKLHTKMNYGMKTGCRDRKLRDSGKKN